MLNGIRKALDANRLAARVAELEDDNKRLRKELSEKLLGPGFQEIKKPIDVSGDLREHIFEQAASDLQPIVEKHLLLCLKQAAEFHPHTMGARRLDALRKRAEDDEIQHGGFCDALHEAPD